MAEDAKQSEADAQNLWDALGTQMLEHSLYTKNQKANPQKVQLPDVAQFVNQPSAAALPSAPQQTNQSSGALDNFISYLTKVLSNGTGTTQK